MYSAKQSGMLGGPMVAGDAGKRLEVDLLSLLHASTDPWVQRSIRMLGTAFQCVASKALGREVRFLSARAFANGEQQPGATSGTQMWQGAHKDGQYPVDRVLRFISWSPSSKELLPGLKIKMDGD